MYDAICDKCGNRCQIPFQPKPGKQVFCSHCFEQQGKEDRDIQERPRNNDQFDALNTKLDKILQLLSSQVAVVTAPEKETTKTRETPESKKAEKKIGKKTPVKKKTVSQKKPSAKTA
jgi:CxxC-x17-CxxC domain-containing protein